MISQVEYADRVWFIRDDDDHDFSAIHENWDADQYHFIDQHPRTVLDIGGNIGSFSLRALAEGAESVVAVEPEPHNIEVFKLNCAREIESGRITLIEAAVWSSACPMLISDHRGASGSGPAKTMTEGVPVKGITLASLLSQPFDFMKMDTEGAEAESLSACPVELLRTVKGMGMEYHVGTVPMWWSEIVYKLTTCFRVIEMEAFAGALNGGMLWGHA